MWSGCFFVLYVFCMCVICDGWRKIFVLKMKINDPSTVTIVFDTLVKYIVQIVHSS